MPFAEKTVILDCVLRFTFDYFMEISSGPQLYQFQFYTGLTADFLHFFPVILGLVSCKAGFQPQFLPAASLWLPFRALAALKPLTEK